jgi:nucleotide-binding universal stress UspA family protein
VNRIVVGVDGSPPSLGAVTWAAQRAEQAHLPLEFVNVLDDEWGSVGVEYAQAAEQRAARLLADTADSNPVPAGVSTRLIHGSAVTELAGVAGEQDLLVVGSHKTGYLRGRAFGSLSVRLAPLVAGSLVVIPDIPFVSGRRGVILGVGPTTSSAAVRIAAEEAQREGQPLILIAAATSEQRSKAADALDRVVGQARTVADDLIIERRIADRGIADALVSASRRAAMLVLGALRPASGRGGSTVHDVLMNPLSAVWIAH